MFVCRICTNTIIHSKNENSVIIYLPSSCCSQMYMLFFSQWNAKGEFLINLHEALFYNVTICNDLSSSKRTTQIIKVVYVTCVLISKSCESLCNRPFNGNLICPSAHLNWGDSFTYDKHLHLICIHVQIKTIHDNILTPSLVSLILNGDWLFHVL